MERDRRKFRQDGAVLTTFAQPFGPAHKARWVGALAATLGAVALTASGCHETSARAGDLVTTAAASPSPATPTPSAAASSIGPPPITAPPAGSPSLATSAPPPLPSTATTTSATATPGATLGATDPRLGRMRLIKKITGHLDEKSVVASGTGLFFAQNMMYLHTVNVYDSDFHLLKIIPDAVSLANLGYPQYPGVYKGAPVEAAFTPDGKDAYISNYSMYGAAPFTREGSDTCKLADYYPDSFVYRIDVASLRIDQAIEVGAVPKYVAVTPNGKYLLVSNWCSYTESIVDVATGRQLAQLPLGAYPRGIAVTPDSSTAYVAVMGSTHIAAIDLHDFSVSTINNVGSAPRHLVISPDGRWLYATINGTGVVDKIDLQTRKVVARVATGKAPRSMTISPDGAALYVVNYESNTMTKLRASDMRIVQTVATDPDPIGITYDAQDHRVWVACYSGSILVFADNNG